MKKKLIIAAFLAAPLLSSIISTIHLVKLFSLGNGDGISVTMAVTYEIGSLSILLALAVIDKINKQVIWGMFTVLFLMQFVGNIYYSFDDITIKLAADPNHIASFKELYVQLYSVIGDASDITQTGIKTVLSFLIGAPIPLISAGFTKSLVNLLKDSELPAEAVDVKTETVSETPAAKQADILLTPTVKIK